MHNHYLELSDAASGEHKFYQLQVDGCLLAIRYGRIGTHGQQQQLSFASPEEALEAAEKKLREKTRKGYQPAEPGQTEKRETRHARLLKAVRRFYGLIALDNQALADECFQQFKEHLQDEDTKEDFEDDPEGLQEYAIKFGATSSLIFSVDWKDSVSLLEEFDVLLSNIGHHVTFSWPCADPGEEVPVAQLMALAHQQLAPHGLQLWFWDTGCDSYQGWLGRTADAEQIYAITAELGLNAYYPEESA